MQPRWIVTLAHLGAGMGDPDIATRVTLLGQLAGEEIVELCAEDTVGDELALLANLGGHFGLRRSLGGRESARASVIQPERCPSSKWRAHFHSNGAAGRTWTTVGS